MAKPKFYLFDVDVVNGLAKRQIAELKGLQAGKPKKSIVVCNVPKARKLVIDEHLQIDILPWKTFLSQLWRGEII